MEIVIFAAWTIGISLITKSNFGLVAGNIARQSAMASTSVGNLEKKMGGLNKVGNIAQNAFIGVGVAAGAAFAVGVKGAADLQDAIAQTAVAMGRSSADIDRMFTGTAMKMSMSTAQSVTDSMALIRTMATSGINNPKDMQALAMPIAQFADTQYLGKNHVAFTDSAALAAKIAHSFGARTPEQLAPILNTLFKMSQDMPDSLKDAGTQLKYYAPKYAEKGVSQQEILMLQATADRLGYGQGKSGTGFLQIYRNLLTPSTKTMAHSQKQLGIADTFINKQGMFNPEGLFNHLHALYAKALSQGKGRDFDQLLNHSFTSNAGLIAGVMSSNAGRTQYDNVKKTMARVHDLPLAQAQLMETLNNKLRLLNSNFQTLLTMIAKPFMQDFASAVGRAADAVGKWADYMSKHPTVAKATGGAMMAIGAIGAGLAIAKFGRIFGLSEKLGKFGHVFLGAHRTPHVEGAARAGGIFRGLGDLFSMKSTRGALAGLKSLNPWFDKFAVSLAKPGFLVELLTKGLFKFGAKAIPVVGEILMLVDVLNFLGAHAKDIGKYIGMAARWIHDNGWGLIKTAVTYVFQGIADVIRTLLNPMNLVKGIGNVWKGIAEGYQGGGPPARTQKVEVNNHFHHHAHA